MDSSTTDAPVQEQAQDIPAQPEEQHAEAETQTSEPTTTQEATQEASDNSQEPDFNATEYAAKKGVDLSTPEGQEKALRSMYEAERRMHQSTAKASELQKQLKDIPYEQVSSDPVAQQALERAASVELAMNVQNWTRDNNITPEQDLAIGSYLTENQDKAVLLKNGYLTLDDIAAMSGALKQDTTAVAQQASRETLEKLANSQRASSTTGNASTGSAPSALTPSNVDSWWDSLGPEGRKNPENRARLDSVLAGK